MAGTFDAKSALITRAGTIVMACAAAWLSSGRARAQDQPSPPSVSPDRIWQFSAPPAVEANGQPPSPAARVVRLDRAALDTLTSSAPLETGGDEGVVMTLPMPDGAFARFRVVESPIISADLAVAYPEIRTYRGQGIDDPTATTRFGWTASGFHSIVLSRTGASFVEPVQRGDLETYQVTSGVQSLEEFVCLLTPGDIALPARPLDQFPITHGASLRTYRMAVAATAEYTAVVGSVSAAASQITTTMNIVNAVFEREIAVRMTVTTGPGNALIFTDPATDGYTNGSPGTMLQENQNKLNAVLGSANFDVGHVFGTMPTGGSGIAFIGVPCDNTYKGQGVSASASPTTNSFAIELVAHEVGHQFNANHTFNGTTSSCGPSRTPEAAYEVGSGSTVMSYSGSCGVENTVRSSNDLFHVQSLNEMTYYITSAPGACGVVGPATNTPPTVTGPGNFTIPAGTPFQLAAAGSDANGDSVTYQWEEYDLGTESTDVASASTDDGSRPIFRAYTPNASPTRTFPSLVYILGNANVPPMTYNCSGQTCLTGEVLPTTNRSMTFQVTARDNRSGGGGIATASSIVTVSNAAGPFQVTSPNTAVSFQGSTSQTVTWNPAGTASAPVNAANVRISLSIDGGATFPTVLLASTPNDGSQTVTIPNVSTASARIRIEAVGNIFFDVSNTNFTITAGMQKVLKVRVTPP